MAGNSIGEAFTKQYEREVHEVYQRTGSHCRGTVRTRTGVVGSTTTFQIYGKGEATAKARNGTIVPMNPTHTNVECLLENRYAPIYIDTLDELKIAHDERQAAVRAGANALGRHTDTQIIEAASGTSNNEGGSGALTKSRVLNALKMLRAADVPFDGNVYGWLTPAAEAQLLNSVDEFTSADFVNVGRYESGAYQAYNWLGVKWMTHSGLIGTGTNAAECLIWHRDSVAHAIQQDVKTDIDYIPERVAHLVNSCLAMGACLIDGTGVVKVVHDDTAALT